MRKHPSSDMKRKIVKQGNSALTLTIPSKWVKKHNLKPGGEVDIEEKENSLILSTAPSTSKSSIVFDSTEHDVFNRYYLGYFYHKGYDDVKIMYEKPEYMQVIREKLPELMGFEITETAKRSCTIRSVSNVDAGEFNVMLRRIFLMLKSMGEEGHSLLEEGNHARLVDLLDMEKTNNKFTDFCIRILNKKNNFKYSACLSLYSLLRELEKIADHYRNLYQYLIEKKVPLRPQTLQVFKQVNDYFALLYELHYKCSDTKLDEVIFTGKKLIKNITIALHSPQPEEAYVLHNLLALTTQTFELKGPVFEIHLANQSSKGL
jgi:phosphate uptake regulator